MRRRTTVIDVATVSAIAVLILIPDTAPAQVRRSSSPDGAVSASVGTPRGLRRNDRLPYAGVWDGLFRVPAPDGSENPMPIVMIFDIADSAKLTYSGATVLPNGQRAPHLETTVTRGEMQWKQRNSGGGFWVYMGRFVTRDSVEGTAVLRDWPQLPAGEKVPAGRFALARRAPGA